jgi:hypothetical protein
MKPFRDILTPMSYRRTLASTCTMLLVITQLSPLFAGDDELSRGSLVGITALDVIVEDLPSGAARIGLTKESIQTDVELKLRLAGMRISSEAKEILSISVALLEDGTTAYIQVALLQSVILTRTPIPTYGATWSQGMLTRNYAAQDVRAVIKDKVDKFLNAWLSVNPKK